MATPFSTVSVAHLECDIDQVIDAGDHVLVIARVRHLETSGSTANPTDRELNPLLFYRGRYSRLAPTAEAS